MPELEKLSISIFQINVEQNNIVFMSALRKSNIKHLSELEIGNYELKQIKIKFWNSTNFQNWKEKE